MLNPFPSTFWSDTTATDLITATVAIFLVLFFFVALSIDSSILPDVVHEIETSNGEQIVLRTFSHR